jgi:hypothetical protein
MNDEELQRRFAALREQESLAAPSFERSWAGAARGSLHAAPRLSRGVRLVLAGCAAAVLVAAFWLVREEPVRPPAPAWEAQLAAIERELAALELRAWQAPSDFLLTANP